MSEDYQRMTTQMNELEDQMALISQMYPGVYTQIAPQQGDLFAKTQDKTYHSFPFLNLA